MPYNFRIDNLTLWSGQLAMTETKQGELAFQHVASRGKTEAIKTGPRLLTIGHSTHAIAAFLSILQSHEVTLIADVRAYPRSRYNPQFNEDALPCSLATIGIAYRHYPKLGGHRRLRADSVNTAWREPAFRGFADHMATAAFVTGLADLMVQATNYRAAVMCAESDPRNCHRWLIADALTAQGVDVAHIAGLGKLRPHSLSAFARLTGAAVEYPALLTD